MFRKDWIAECLVHTVLSHEEIALKCNFFLLFFSVLSLLRSSSVFSNFFLAIFLSYDHSTVRCDVWNFLLSVSVV